MASQPDAVRGAAEPVGLSAAQAADLLRTVGPNELAAARPRTALQIAWGVATEPMFLLLVACGVIYLLLGDPGEAAMLLGFVVIVMGITLVQQRRTERALDALRDLSSPRALVLRDGRRVRVAGREVVPGDVMEVAEGDRVAADAVLLSGMNVAVDESLLTGESVTVRKASAEGDTVTAMGPPGGDDRPWLFSGTLVVQGKGLARVVATGAQTELGRIGRALEARAPEPTRVQRETGQVVRRIAVAGGVLSLLVALVYALTRDDWLNGLLVGVTMAMALLPEELPVVLTIFLGFGAWRIGQRRVLTRRVPALEMLGAATVLCVDKTGTLTTNRMRMAVACVGDREQALAGQGPAALDESVHTLVEFAVLASQRDPVDPMERAIRDAGLAALEGTEHLHADWTLVDEYPLSRALLAMSRVWRSPSQDRYVIAAKGAPEAIVDLCHLDAEAAAAVLAQTGAMAARGLRVLGVARAGFDAGALPDHQHRFAFELLGLIGLADPVRDGVPEAVAECRQAGIRVVMITGDYPATALAIGERIGLRTGNGAVTGAELDTLSDEALRARLAGTDVFCRVSPEQKLRLVDTLKAQGEVVAMTGDGVNDAPALKAAHIGIAMGGRGTDVAREAASLVLLDDDFGSIVAAVRLGRRVFDNLGKAIAYVVAVHVPIAGLSMIPVLFGWPLVLMPVHILFMELIIDPACSIVFEAEPEEDDVMRRPPRAADARLFERRLLLRALIQGMCLLAVALVVHQAGMRLYGDADTARAMAFVVLVLGNLGLILSERSQTRGLLQTIAARNAPLWWVAGAAVAFLGLVVGVAPVRALFHFGALDAHAVGLAALAAVAALILFEGVKRAMPLRRAVRA